MLSQFLGDFGTDELIDVLDAISEGMSGGQIREITDNSARAAILANAKQIELKQAVDSVLSSRADLRDANSLDDRVLAVRDIDRKVFTQKRVAELFNISQSHVSYIEKRFNGRSKVSPDSSLRTA